MLIIRTNRTNLFQLLKKLEEHGYLWHTGKKPTVFLPKREEVIYLYLKKDERTILFSYSYPVFKAEDSCIVSDKKFLTIAHYLDKEELELKTLIGKTVRIVKNYSGHNFKIGTEAFIVDVEDGVVQVLGYTNNGNANVFFLTTDDFEVIEDE